MYKVKLGDICTVVSGSTPKSNVEEYWNGSIKWITPAEITSDSYIITDTERHITDKAVEKTNLTLLPVGTVLLSSRAPIGKTAITGAEMYCNQGFKNLICSERIYNKYLYFFLNSKVDYLNELGRGATFKEISKGIVEEVEIPLPSLDEQKNIVRHLEVIQQLINNRKQALSTLDELVKSRFIEMFGEYSAITTLAKVSDMVTVGIANSATHAYCNDGVVMLRNQNIKKNQLDDDDLIYIEPTFADKYKAKTLKTNDILVTRTGYPGIACMVPSKYEGAQTFTTLIVRVNSDSDVLPLFLCHYINSDSGKNFVAGEQVGVAQKNFGAKSLAKMPIPLPPVELQKQYAAFVEQTDKSKFAVQQSIDTLQTLKAKLMQDYFG